jgi:MFS family permease
VALTTRQRGVLLAAGAATALTFFDQTATTAALGDMEHSLGASVGELQWVMGAYLLVLAAVVPAAGRLADVHGRRRLFLIGVAVFGLASVGCALAPSIGALIALRAVQGIGAALIVPLALANVAVVVPEERRGWAIGVLATGGSTFLSLGPLLGGLLVELGGWRWVFLVGVPVALVSFWAGARWMEESWGAGSAAGAAGTAGAGLSSRPAGSLAGAAGAAGAGLGRAGGEIAAAPSTAPHVGRRASLAGRWLALLRIPAVSGSMAALLAGQFAVTALTVELMLYLQRTLGYGALAAGLLFLPAVIATPLLSPYAGRLADRGRGRPAVLAGLLAAAAALGWIALTAGEERIWLLLPALALFGLSRPFVFTPSSTAPVTALPARDRGTASALVTEAYQLGALLGVAVGGLLVAGGDFVAGLRWAIALAALLCLGAAVAARALLPDAPPMTAPLQVHMTPRGAVIRSGGR